MSDDDAVFLPSVETALQIVHDAAPRFGESVLVLGLGIIGTLVSLLLARMEVTAVVADPLQPRRSRLADLGFLTVDPMAPTAARTAVHDTTSAARVGVTAGIVYAGIRPGSSTAGTLARR